MTDKELKTVLGARNKTRSLMNDQTFKNADPAKSMEVLNKIAEMLKSLKQNN